MARDPSADLRALLDWLTYKREVMFGLLVWTWMQVKCCLCVKVGIWRWALELPRQEHWFTLAVVNPCAHSYPLKCMQAPFRHGTYQVHTLRCDICFSAFVNHHSQTGISLWALFLPDYEEEEGANKWENSPVAGFQAPELPIPSPIIHLPSPTGLWSGSLPLALPTVMSLSISLQCRAPPLWNHLEYWWISTHYCIACFSKSSIHSQFPFFLFPLSVPWIPQVIFLVLCPVSIIHSVYCAVFTSEAYILIWNDTQKIIMACGQVLHNKNTHTHSRFLHSFYIKM